MPPIRRGTSGAAPRRVGLREHVVVTATRLPGPEVKQPDVPAHVTVIDRRRIEASARGPSRSCPLRGGVSPMTRRAAAGRTHSTWRLSRGTGMAVYLEGARLNDPRNNQVALELIRSMRSIGSRSSAGRHRRSRGAGRRRASSRYSPDGRDEGGGVSMASGTHGALDAAGAAQWRWRKAGGFASARWTGPTASGRTRRPTRNACRHAGVELAGGGGCREPRLRIARSRQSRIIDRGGVRAEPGAPRSINRTGWRRIWAFSR